MKVRAACAVLAAVGAVIAGAAVTGCNLSITNRAEARDQWQRHYTLAKGGTFAIRNTNGLVHLESSDKPDIDVTADRIVQAGTDAAAREALSGFEIAETVSPDRVALDSSTHATGLLLNLSQRVDYRVRVPEWANIEIDTTNSDVQLEGPRHTGTFRAEATNGRITAVGVANGARIGTTNGEISVSVDKLGDDGLTCTTTNGAILVRLARDLGARLTARVTNGAVKADGLDMTVSEESRRRLDATVNGGGPTVKLETTNGAIRISAK
jgi:hypothetical protein